MSQTIKSVFVDGQGTGQLTQALGAKSQYGEGENRLVTFIDNHDVNRIGLFISQQGDTGRINYVMKPALTFLYTATPVPCLFYGTEHAFNQGGHFNGSAASFDNPDDGDWQRENMSNRGFQPGPANGNKLVQTDAPQYLHIKALNEARRNYPALTRGSFTERWQSGGAGAYAYSRVLLDQEALVALNTADGNQSINPQVGKPNGTEFVNVLNPSEKVTVSNGRISFSLGGKDSKIFVAGALSKASEARATSGATDVTITYVPHDGPLKNAVGTIQVGLRIDGGAEEFFDMTAGPNGTWAYTRPFDGISTTLAVSFRDSASIPTVDTTGGAAWEFDATRFGQSLVAWVGNTLTFPAEGAITAADDLWIDVEAYPVDAAAGGKVVYTTDDGGTWQETPLTKSRVVGNNDLLNANLGKFPVGTTVKFAVQVVDTNGVAQWDNNDGLDFARTVQAGTLAIGWSGRVNHWPVDGEIEATSDLWVNVESWPQGAGVGGEVLYSTDGGSTYQTKPLTFRVAQDNNDFWNCNLGSFPAGTTIRYAVKLVDTTNGEHWHNSEGADFSAMVNGQLSSLSGFADIDTLGLVPATPPDRVGLVFGEDGSLSMETGGRNPANQYEIQRTDDLTDWNKYPSIPVQNPDTDIWQLMSANEAQGMREMFYRVVAAGGTTEQVYVGSKAVVRARSVPPNGAQAANLVYSLDGGATWEPATAMTRTPGVENDLWSVEIPDELGGNNRIKFAIQFIDQQGNSTWANNDGADYVVNVARPGQTDFEPPVAGHSPSETTTSAFSLQVMLSATDDTDPAPVIHYTRDGSAPTTSSPIYALALDFVANGTLRYFAIDAAGQCLRRHDRGDCCRTDAGLRPRPAVFDQPEPRQRRGQWQYRYRRCEYRQRMDRRQTHRPRHGQRRPPQPREQLDDARGADQPHAHVGCVGRHVSLSGMAICRRDRCHRPCQCRRGGQRTHRHRMTASSNGSPSIPTRPPARRVDMWEKNEGEPLWTGADKPDYQIYLAGSLWQGFVSRAVDNVFPVDDGGVNYFPIAGAGITAGKGATFAGTSLWGVGDADDRRSAEHPTRNFLAEGHATDRDSFYEIKIPLAFLGLTKAQLESPGIGVMIGAGSNSPSMSCRRMTVPPLIRRAWKHGIRPSSGVTSIPSPRPSPASARGRTIRDWSPASGSSRGS